MSYAQSRNLAIRLGVGALVALLLIMPAAAVTAATPNTPQQVGANTPVTFSGNGFKPNEDLSIWEIGPDGTIVPLAGINSDGTGAFSTTVTFPNAGQWQVTVHSRLYGNESVGIFTVGPGTGTTTAPTTPSAPAPSPGVVPPANQLPPPAVPAAPQVAVGAAVIFSGTGFTANEQISLWETAPGGVVTTLPGTQADGTGGFSASVSFPSNGQWQVTAHGVTSTHETIGRYAVGDVSAAAAAPAAGATGATQVGVGVPVTFSGTGFTANERISLWETAPGSNVVALPGTTADSNGAFTTSISFSPAGQWEITAHGITSTHEVIGTYQVGAAGSATTGTAPVGPGSAVGSNAPQVALGSPVTVSATGFTAGEAVSFWETGPDSTVTPLSSVVADTNGAVSTSVTFATAGYWQVTAHGQTSAHEIVSAYNVTGGATTTAPVSSTVAPNVLVQSNTTVGTVVNFSAPGFNANEVVNAWTTAPDNTVARLDTTTAVGNGRASVSTSFGTAGRWLITLRGKDSGREVTGQYQVT